MRPNIRMIEISDEAYKALEKIVEEENGFYRKQRMEGFTLGSFVEQLIAGYLEK